VIPFVFGVSMVGSAACCLSALMCRSVARGELDVEASLCWMVVGTFLLGAASAFGAIAVVTGVLWIGGVR